MRSPPHCLPHLLIGETIADEQMWHFQQDKKACQHRGETIEAPFFR
jgi:hypothetical protein